MRLNFINKFKTNKFKDRHNTQSKAQRFIHIQMMRTNLFLKRNPHIKIFQADKGGKIVITDSNTYKEKMDSYLKSNTDNGFYYHCKNLDFEHARSFCEAKYDELRPTINMYLTKDTNLNYKHPLKFCPFIMPIYGYFKIHKADFPIRPIISATNSMGKPLATWMLHKLGIIAKHLNQYQIKSAHDLFDKIEGRRLNNERHVLISWDYNNMFTNIPFGTTKTITKELYHLIVKETTMPWHASRYIPERPQIPYRR